MKPLHFPFSAYIIYALLFSSALAQGQSITINSVSGTSFCFGDPVSVTFTASGDWSQNKNNAFTIQLSDTNGSFGNAFKNLGSLKQTASGTFTVTAMMSENYPVSTHYRIRVTGSYPYLASLDNGQDLTIGRVPAAFLEIANFATYTTTPNSGPLFIPVGAQVGSSVQIKIPSDDLHPDPVQNATKYDWDFGLDATPQNASGIGAIEQLVTYSTGGDKTVTMTLTGPTGCTSSATITHHIFDCSNPSIPKHAIVDSGTLSYDIHQGKKVIWVNSGVTLYLDGSFDTVFCEPNSTIIDRPGNNVVYLKPGASYSDAGGKGSYSTIIHADGVSLDLNAPNYNAQIHCPNLNFDYTNAPPNVAHPLAVKNDLSSWSISLSPNPTTGTLSVKGLPSENINVTVINILGETVMEVKNPNSSDFPLDLSNLAAGTYYVRFSSANSVTTKKIIKQ